MWRSYFTEKKWLLWSLGWSFSYYSAFRTQTYIDVIFNNGTKDFMTFYKQLEKENYPSFMMR